jgi:hypothetical protein
MSWFTEARRAYIYRILLAVGALAAGYGIIADNELALWLGVATSILNIMPVANTHSKQGEVPVVDDQDLAGS